MVIYMNIVFISNYLNHHQLPLCLALLRLSNNNFHFIATSSISQERLALGYKDISQDYDFIIQANDNDNNFKYSLSLIQNSDIAIIGSAPEKFVSERIKMNKMVFRYYERIYKVQPPIYKIPVHMIKNIFNYRAYKNQYILCASAYTASDFRLTYSFVNRTYKWGYFPETIQYEDIKKLIDTKKENSILWAGRLIDWKHPEVAVRLAQKLKSKNIPFSLNIIGNGEMKESLYKLITDYGLQKEVKLLGSMSPENVRKFMEECEIFIFTSDRKEGWGAVLNESMNSACAVVANREIGATPYLINNGNNGMIYSNGNFEELCSAVIELLENSSLRKSISLNAYNTIVDMWNADVAASRLLKLFECLMLNKETPYLDGPCSLS